MRAGPWSFLPLVASPRGTQQADAAAYSRVDLEGCKADYHPVIGTQGVLIMITGNLIVDGGAATPLKFAQTFHIAQSPTGGYFVGMHD